MNFFRAYQYAAPAVLLPISYWLWWQRYEGDHRMVLLAMSLPVLFAYVVPGIGTNVLRLWEIHARLRIGRFRPHHGLVFGAATSWFALLSLPYPGDASWLEPIRAGFVLGSVLAFWNWLYDAYAIKAGFISVYTRKYHEGAAAEAIATDYAPVLFGVFGFCYGASIRALEYVLITKDEWRWMGALIVACQAICLFTPVAAYVAISYLRTGESGLRSYERVSHEA